MPRNGLGVYVPPVGQPVVPGTTISSTVFNALVADLGGEVTRSVSTDGQTPMAASLPMGGNKITGLAAGVNPSDAVRVDQLSNSSLKVNVSDLAASSGASLVGYIVAGVGAIWRTVQDKLRERKTGQDYGVVADGVTEDTAAMQTAIDQNKGGTIVFRGGPHLCAGLLLSGPTYNNTTLIFESPLLLKTRPTAGTSNFGGGWVGLIIKDCDGVTLSFKGDGQRTTQPAEEHCHLVGFAGVTNIKVPLFIAKEIRGDGLYIGQSDWQANSANTSGVTIGVFEAVNSADDGRNGLSIVSGDNINVDTFRSYKVGGVIGAARMPGGLDIEPDHDYQSCKNIVIGSVNVTTTGTSGLAVAGRAGFDVTRGIAIGSARVVNTCPPDQNDGAGNLTATVNHTLIVANATDVKIPNYLGCFTNAFGDAVIVSNATGVEIKGLVRHAREGARIGGDASDVAGAGVVSSVIDLQVFESCRYGIRTGKLVNTTVKGKVHTPTAGYYPGGLFAVYARDFAQTGIEYSVSVQASADWTRSYRNDNGVPATLTNCCIRDCDLSGSTWANIVNQAGDIIVPRFNVRGITDQASVPTAYGTVFSAGQYVRNSAPAVGQPKGWYLVGGAWVSEGNL